MAGNYVRWTAQIKDEVTSKLGKIRDDFDRLGKTKGFQAVAQGVGIGAGIGAWNLLSGAVGKGVGFLEDSVQVALKAEASQAKLNAALSGTIDGFDYGSGAAAKYQNRIAAVETANRKLGFSNDATLESLAALVPATHSFEAAVNAQAVAEDLARFKGISLAEASAALVKVEAGRYKGLAALGIAVKDFSSTEEAMAAVEKVVFDQREAYASTTAGKLDAAQANLDDKMEHLGNVLLPLVSTGADIFSSILDDVTGANIAAAFATQQMNAQLALTPGYMRASADAFGKPVTPAGLNDIAAAADRIDVKLMAAKTTWDTFLADVSKPQTRQDLATKIWNFGDLQKDISTTTGDIKDLQKEIDSGKLTGSKLDDANARLRTLKERLADDVSQATSLKGEALDAMKNLVGVGAVPQGSLPATIAKWTKDLRLSASQAYTFMQYLLRIASLERLDAQGGGAFVYGSTKNTKYQQHGGPVTGGDYIVGEGPGDPGERLHLSPGSMGWVTPNMGLSRAATASGNPVVISMQLDGIEIGRIVDKYLFYALSTAAGTTSRV